jgi:uncharacterized protein (TIGR02266 family)
MTEGVPNRRQHPRRPLELVVQLSFESRDQFISAHARDVSLGGMFIRCDRQVTSGAVICLQFVLTGGDKLFEGLVRVAHVNQAGSPGEPGFGVEFMSLDDESQALIEAIVSGRQRQSA